MSVNIESKIRSEELDCIAHNNDANTKRFIDDRTNERKSTLLRYFNAADADWNNFHWQMEHRISTVNQLNDIFGITTERFDEIEKVSEKYRWSISPYYLSLIDVSDYFDPLGLMAVPCILELNEQGESDPMNEEFTNPAPFITRRYPDRLIMNVTNSCGMFCRFCQRKRNNEFLSNNRLCYN